MESSVTNQNMVTSIQAMPISGLSADGVSEAGVVNTGFDPFSGLPAGNEAGKIGGILSGLPAIHYDYFNPTINKSVPVFDQGAQRLTRAIDRSSNKVSESASIFT